MLETVANFVTSIIGAGVVIWTIFAVIDGYEKQSEENERKITDDFIE